MSASRSFTALTISTVLVPDCFRICSSTVPSPLMFATVSGRPCRLRPRDVADPHRMAGLLPDHDVAELGDALNAAARAQRQRLGP